MPTSFLASDPILDQDRENTKFPQKESGIHPIFFPQGWPIMKNIQKNLQNPQGSFGDGDEEDPNF
jgi:hypothetical protein